MNKLFHNSLNKLKELEIGHPVEVNILPSENKRLTPVTYLDGRGEKKIGCMSAINIYIEFDDGTFCFVHPDSILHGGDYTSSKKCKLL